VIAIGAGVIATPPSSQWPPAGSLSTRVSTETGIGATGAGTGTSGALPPGRAGPGGFVERPG
jgi:hypothetical protein